MSVGRLCEGVKASGAVLEANVRMGFGGNEANLTGSFVKGTSQLNLKSFTSTTDLSLVDGNVEANSGSVTLTNSLNLGLSFKALKVNTDFNINFGYVVTGTSKLIDAAVTYTTEKGGEYWNRILNYFTEK